MSHCKHVAITGITSGLGLALTRALLAAGHRVSGCARREDPFAEEGPPVAADRYAFAQVDVLDAVAVDGWAAEVTARAPVDLLVHNAAVMHREAPVAAIDPGELEQVVQVNVLGSFQVLRAMVPRLTAAGHGIIVLLSSGAGRRGIAGMSGYCASKWAVEGLAKSVAEELPEPLACIPLAPGVIDTPMLRVNFGDAAGNHQTPEAWAAKAVPFLLGLSRADNGQSHRIA